MPIQVHRDEAYPTAIVLTFSRVWTIDEMYAAWGQAFAMRDETPGTVHYIYDCRAFHRFPPGILSAISYVAKNVTPENLNIILGGNVLVATVARLFDQTSRQITVVYAQSPEDAYQYIEEQAASPAD